MESVWTGGMVEPRGEAGRLQEGNLEGISREVKKIKEEFVYLSVLSKVAPPYSPPQPHAGSK